MGFLIEDITIYYQYFKNGFQRFFFKPFDLNFQQSYVLLMNRNSFDTGGGGGFQDACYRDRFYQ